MGMCNQCVHVKPSFASANIHVLSFRKSFLISDKETNMLSFGLSRFACVSAARACTLQLYSAHENLILDVHAGCMIAVVLVCWIMIDFISCLYKGIHAHTHTHCRVLIFFSQTNRDRDEKVSSFARMNMQVRFFSGSAGKIFCLWVYICVFHLRWGNRNHLRERQDTDEILACFLHV